MDRYVFPEDDQPEVLTASAATIYTPRSARRSVGPHPSKGR